MEQRSGNKPELLAPAGDMSALYSAVAGGADAVYLGLTDFNARNKAKNFTLDELGKAVEYCHKRGVRVYLALNTIIKDSEMSGALAAAESAYKLGVDAVIVQDLALLIQLKRRLPGLPVHASTQMGIHNAAGAKFVKELGAERAVLSRETVYQDIKEISKTGIGVEFFVHGAMCVSFSGNCYFSSIVSGYSGNRGKCMQLCRKKYTISNYKHKKTGYMLSPKDVCMLPVLDKLTAAGVGSLKIEGRLRNPDYVFTAADVYSTALSGKTEGARQRLTAAFNRGGFSTLYIENDKADIIYDARQNNTGLIIGKVISVNPLKVGGNYKPTKGDGLKFFRNGREVAGGSFEGGRYNLLGTPAIGDSVHLTKSGAASIEANKRINADSAAGKRAEIVPNEAEKSAISNKLIEKPFILPEKYIAVRVDENISQDILNISDIVIFAPADYSLRGLTAFRNRTDKPLLLDMPPLARGGDVELLEQMAGLDVCEGYVANNIYALELCRNKNILLGSGMNIMSDIIVPKIASIENAVPSGDDLIYAFGRYALMQLSHCPRRQLGFACGNCGNGPLTLKDESGNEFILRRRKLHYCYFEMLNSKVTNLLPKLDNKYQKILIDAVSVSEAECRTALKKLRETPFEPTRHTSGRFGKGVK